MRFLEEDILGFSRQKPVYSIFSGVKIGAFYSRLNPDHSTSPLVMKPAARLASFILVTSTLLVLSGCAITDEQAVSNNDIYSDPDTKRLEAKEGMTRITRELSVNY